MPVYEAMTVERWNIFLLFGFYQDAANNSHYTACNTMTTNKQL